MYFVYCYVNTGIASVIIAGIAGIRPRPATLGLDLDLDLKTFNFTEKKSPPRTFFGFFR